MKKLILLTIAITALVTSVYCQVDTLSAKTNGEYIRNQYLVKAKNQKTAAWVCLGGGFALATTGFILASFKAVDDVIIGPLGGELQVSNYTGETILALVGVAGMVTSIPLFIASGNNKQKAKLMVTIQKTAERLPVTVAKNIPGVTLSISL